MNGARSINKGPCMLGPDQGASTPAPGAARTSVPAAAPLLLMGAAPPPARAGSGSLLPSTGLATFGAPELTLGTATSGG